MEEILEQYGEVLLDILGTLVVITSCFLVFFGNGQLRLWIAEVMASIC